MKYKIERKQDIAANNYNLDIKNTNTVDEGHGDPKELMESLGETK